MPYRTKRQGGGNHRRDEMLSTNFGQSLLVTGASPSHASWPPPRTLWRPRAATVPLRPATIRSALVFANGMKEPIAEHSSLGALESRFQPVYVPRGTEISGSLRPAMSIPSTFTFGTKVE